MLNLLLQTGRGRTVLSTFRQLGAPGLFFLAIIDSSPFPGFSGPDILIAILAVRQRIHWYELAAVATGGSVIGAFITYRVARKAGHAYLERFGKARVARFLELFKRRGTGTLVASAAIPFPLPTSLVFAVAGVSQYPVQKYLSIVAAARAARYCAIAILAQRYGRGFVRILRHPAESWGLLFIFAFLIAAFVATGILLNRRWVATAVH